MPLKNQGWYSDIGMRLQTFPWLPMLGPYLQSYSASLYPHLYLCEVYQPKAYLNMAVLSSLSSIAKFQKRYPTYPFF